jgi:arginine decarboxylase
MPGHKGRGCGSLPFDAALPFDVTELDPTDNLYDPSENGVFRAELDFMRTFYGTAATVLTAGGATAALCAAFACCARRAPGLPVLCDRKAHISVINALALLGIEPIWFDAGSGDICGLSHKYDGLRVSAVFCTSPDYYGRARDIPALAELARTLGVPLVVDNSHGAHLFFHNGGALYPLKQGATLVVDSLHKTLPALTGAALLHAAADTRFGFTEQELRSALRMFVSTSPSYLISSSACGCLREMAEHGEAAHAKLFSLVSDARAALERMDYTLDNPGGDPFRICISDANARGLYDFLAEGGVVCEFCDGRTVVLLTSVRNTAADFELLVTLCGRFTPSPPVPEVPFEFRLPVRAMSPRDAMLAMQEYVLLDDAPGRIATAPAAPYPPGIPVIVPGEVFDDFVIETLRKHNPDMTVAVTAYNP